MIAKQNDNETKTLREWRAYKRMTKCGVAKEIGVHPATYARMENNPSSVSMREATLLAETFGCETSEIFFLE